MQIQRCSQRHSATPSGCLLCNYPTALSQLLVKKWKPDHSVIDEKGEQSDLCCGLNGVCSHYSITNHASAMVRVSHVWLCAETVLKRKPRTDECSSFYVSVGRRGKSSFFLLTDAAIRLAYTPQTLLPSDIDCVDFDFASATRSLAGYSNGIETQVRI